jgi:two-component system sensor histidine kinase TorS
MNIKTLAGDLGLEEAEYLELMELMVDTAISDIDQLQSAVGKGDAEHAASIAHSIKGAAGNLGLLRFYDVAGKFEESARQGNLDGASASIQALKNNLKEIQALVGK